MCYHKPLFQKEKISKFLKRKTPYEPNNRYKSLTALLSINFSKKCENVSKLKLFMDSSNYIG